VVDNDHMTHLYNSYIVVDITPGKVVKDKNSPKRQKGPLTSWLLSLPPFRKSGGKPSSSLHQEGPGQVPAGFQARKVFTVVPGQVSWKDDNPVHMAASVQDPNGDKDIKTIWLPHHWPNIATGDFSPFGERSWSWLAFRCPWTASRRAFRGRLNHCQRRVCWLFPVDGPIEKVHSAFAVTRTKNIPKKKK
jgi:hypothetical protein